MRAGALRHLVTIQKPVTVKSGGSATTEWEDFATNVRASIEQMKAFDKAQLNTIWPGADYTIGMRWRPGITGDMRIVGPDGAIYAILGQPNDIDGRHRELVLTCQSGVKAG